MSDRSDNTKAKYVFPSQMPNMIDLFMNYSVTVRASDGAIVAYDDDETGEHYVADYENKIDEPHAIVYDPDNEATWYSFDEDGNLIDRQPEHYYLLELLEEEIPTEDYIPDFEDDDDHDVWIDYDHN